MRTVRENGRKLEYSTLWTEISDIKRYKRQTFPSLLE